MDKIVVHVGAPKTASTLLQKTLDASTDFLRKYDTVYSRALSKSLYTEIYSKQALLKSHKEWFNTNIHKIQDENKWAKILFLSHEGLFGSREYLYTDSYSYASDLKNVTGDFDIDVIIFIRRQDTFIESLYSQLIHEGGILTFDDFLSATNWKVLHWGDLIGPFLSLFKNVYIFPYEDVANNRDKFFSNALSSANVPTLPPSIESTPETLNPSLSNKGLEIARRCNPIITKEESKLLRRFLQTYFYKNPKECASLLTEKMRREIIDYFKDSNKNFFEQHIKGYEFTMYW